MLNQALDALQEASRWRTVHQSVVESKAQRTHLPGHDFAILHYSLGLNPPTPRMAASGRLMIGVNASISSIRD